MNLKEIEINDISNYNSNFLKVDIYVYNLLKVKFKEVKLFQLSCENFISDRTIILIKNLSWIIVYPVEYTELKKLHQLCNLGNDLCKNEFLASVLKMKPERFCIASIDMHKDVTFTDVLVGK